MKKIQKREFWSDRHPVRLVALVVVSTLLFCDCASRSDRIVNGIISDEVALNGEAASNAMSAARDAPESRSNPLDPALAMAGGNFVFPSFSSNGSAVPVGGLTIQPESIVQVSVEEDPSLDGAYEVNNSSSIEFGYVGLVFLENMTTDQAALRVKSTLEARGFKSATVSVRIIKSSYDKVRVSGGVMKPSDLKIGPGSTILVEDALRRAEGLRPQAQGTKIKIVRSGMLSPFGIAAEGEEYSLVGVDGKPAVPKVAVGNNDWIYVFAGEGEFQSVLGEKQILVLGEVGNPGIISFSGGEPCTMLHLMLKIGGLPKWADQSDIKVIRRSASGEETEMRLDIRKLVAEGSPEDDTPLENGDRIIIQERTLFF